MRCPYINSAQWKQDIIFVQNAASILLLQTDRLAIETVLRLGSEKFNGVVSIRGSQAFRHRSAVIAAETGIPLRFEDHRLELIREQRVAELAAERAQRVAHRELGRQYSQRRTSYTSVSVDKPLSPELEFPTAKSIPNPRSAPEF